MAIFQTWGHIFKKGYRGYMGPDKGVWGFVGFRVPQIRGYHFGGPYYQDSSILGSILRSPYVNKLPHVLLNKVTLVTPGPQSYDSSRGLIWGEGG